MSIEINPEQHPNLVGLTLEEILTAADRWRALDTVPNVQVLLAEGFSAEEQERAPAQRLLMLNFKTRPEFEGADDADDCVSASLRMSALSKLTDLADLMRAAAVEVRHARPIS